MGAKMSPVAPTAEQKPTETGVRGIRPPRPRSTARSGWLAVSGLLVLSALPVIGGVLRLSEGRGDREGDVLVVAMVAMVAIITHIVAMSAFCVLGAFQFSPALRVRHRWHRRVGRVLIPAGFLAALSSVVLVVVFGGAPEEFPIAVVRLIFAVPMMAFLAFAVVAILRRDFIAHGAWMTRAYAIAVSGGTQAIVAIVWSIPFGETDAAGEAWVVGIGFALNSLIAEGIIRRRGARASVRRAGTVRRG